MASRNQLKSLLPLGSTVSLRVQAVDRYGRSVAEVIGNKGMVNLAMVRSGQAFVYRHLTEGKTVLLDPSAVATVYFGPAQVVMDEYSNGKSLSGAAEICVFNFADLAVLRPTHVVVGSA